MTGRKEDLDHCVTVLGRLDMSWKCDSHRDFFHIRRCSFYKKMPAKK